jgi:hypothetical protein
MKVEEHVIFFPTISLLKRKTRVYITNCMNYQLLDKQIKTLSKKLAAEVGLRDDEVGNAATTVPSEVRLLDPASKETILTTSPYLLRSLISFFVSTPPLFLDGVLSG